MTKKIRPNELSEDELDCVTGGASTQEEETNLRIATAVNIVPVSAKANKVLPKSLAGKAVAAGRPAQMAKTAAPKPIEGVRTSNVGRKVKGR